jgi:flagellin
LRSQTNGIQRAVQNTQEANNVSSIGEGAMSEMNNILTKMKELALHASNNGITSADQAEVDSAVQPLDRIARTTMYSSDSLFNGSTKNSMDMSIIDKGLTDIQ